MKRLALSVTLALFSLISLNRAEAQTPEPGATPNATATPVPTVNPNSLPGSEFMLPTPAPTPEFYGEFRLPISHVASRTYLSTLPLNLANFRAAAAARNRDMGCIGLNGYLAGSYRNQVHNSDVSVNGLVAYYVHTFYEISEDDISVLPTALAHVRASALALSEMLLLIAGPRPDPELANPFVEVSREEFEFMRDNHVQGVMTPFRYSTCFQNDPGSTGTPD